MRILLALFMLFPVVLNAQSIISGEYFYDNDPGIGNGIELMVNSPGDSIELSLSINTTGLPSGSHAFGFRTMYANGVWSQTVTRDFHIDPDLVKQNEKIVAAEYFIDTDPGTGKGIPVNVPVSGDSIQTSFQVSDTISSGVHMIVVRTLNEQGRWSLQYAKEFTVCSTYGAVASFDYYVDRKTVYFTNNSQYDTAFKWTFGDGTTEISAQNPTHIYSQPGLYNVCLEASNACATTTVCRQVPVAGLQSVYPEYSSNNNRILMHLRGVGFIQGATVELVRQGLSIQPDTSIFISSTDLKLNFQFNGEPTGSYNLVVTNPSSVPDTLYNAFKLQATIKPNIKLSYIGSSRVRVSTNAFSNFSLTNNGNQTAYMVPIIIIIPEESAGYVYPMVDMEVDPAVDPSSYPLLPPNRAYPLDNPLNPEAPPRKILAAVIPMIGPGETANFPVNVYSPVTQCTELKVTAGKPMGKNDFLDQFTNSCTFLPDALKCAMDLAGYIPGVGCVTGSFGFGCSIGNEINDQLWGTNKSHWYDLVGSTAGMVLGCFGGLGKGALGVAANIVGDATGGMGTLADCYNALDLDEPQNPSRTIVICHSSSMDPNTKIGPAGLNDFNFINNEQILDYTVMFENMDTATAPAAEVVITDLLDTALVDLNTFRIRAMGFGDTVIFADDEVTNEWVREVDLKKGKNILLRVHAHLDTISGLLTWRFTSFDTLTMKLTTDPDLGFLSPNVNSPEGEGFISYSVKPKSGLSHGTTIGNSASIVFDYNDPIITNTWINTIDNVKPESNIIPLPATVQDTTFTIYMNGFDANSGINSYNVYYSINNGAFKPLASNSAEDSIKFTGKENYKYEFFSQAIDNADNREDTLQIFDAVTEIHLVVTNNSELTTLQNIQAYPNPVYDLITFSFEPSSETFSLMADILDLNGRLMLSGQKITDNKTIIDLRYLKPGAYIIRLTDIKTGRFKGAVRIIKF